MIDGALQGLPSDISPERVSTRTFIDKGATVILGKSGLVLWFALTRALERHAGLNAKPDGRESREAPCAE